MNCPSNLKYTKSDEWIRVEGEFAFVGITTLAEGETFGSIEAVKTVAPLEMPVSGEIVEVNAELEDAPELVNNDPYGKGWMIKIAIKDASELDKLMDAAGYEAYRG